MALKGYKSVSFETISKSVIVSKQATDETVESMKQYILQNVCKCLSCLMNILSEKDREGNDKTMNMCEKE